MSGLNMKEPQFADVYLRYSSHMQDDGNSIEYQMEDVKEYCKRNNIIIREWYIDRATSATKTAGRDDFYRYIDDVKAGRASGIFLVWRTNRAFRNSYESHKYRRFFREKGIRYDSVTQSIDEETSAGRLTTSIMSEIDQYKSEEISEHVSAALRVMAKDGLFIGGVPPFGYKLVDVDWNGKLRKKLAPDEEEAQIVREVFERVANGASIRGTQIWLAGTGYLSRKGKPFAHSSVQEMLKNQVYIGTRIHNSKYHEPIIVPNAHEPIIDQETFDRAQKILVENKSKVQGRARTKRIYALTGKMVCGKCGTPLHGWAASEYQYYVCGCTRKDLSCSLKRVRKDKLEKAVFEAVIDNLLSESAKDKIACTVMKQIRKSPTKVGDKKTYIKQKEKLLAEVVKLVEKNLAGQITDETLAIMKAQREAEIQTLTAKIKEVELIHESHLDEPAVRRFVSQLFNADREFADTDGEVLKELFTRTVDNIVVTDTQIEIYLRISFGKFLFNGSYAPLFFELNKKIDRSTLARR